jgi:hypothetical protein
MIPVWLRSGLMWTGPNTDRIMISNGLYQCIGGEDNKTAADWER